MPDPLGTCHLVGCAGKGVHGPEGPHSLKADPPAQVVNGMTAYQSYIDHLEDKAEAAGVRLMKLSEQSLADRVFPKIGAAESWAPYEGGPAIPKPHSYCLGYVVLRVDTRTNVCTVACSIAGDEAWGLLLTSGDFNMATFVDAHKRDCPNRVVR